MAVEMKDTGIEWIGKIPKEWEVNKIKYSAILKGRIGWQGLTTAEYRDEGPFLITGIDFADGSIDWEHCEHVELKRWAEDPYIQITNGDLLITKDGTVGKTAIVDGLYDKATLNSGVLLIRTDDTCNRRYLYWILNSQLFWKWFNVINSGNSTIIHLYQGDFNNFVYPVPDKTEQKKIVDFLDKQTAKIDAIIKTNEQQLEILKKYKKSLITQTVTKGLLKNEEKKNKGIEWEISRLKYEVEGIFDIDHYMPDSIDKGIPYVMTGDLRDLFSQIDFSSCKQISESDYRKLSKKIKTDIGDIIFARYATIGTVCFVDVEIKNLISYSCVTIKTKKNRLLGKYLYYYLKSSAFIQEIEKYINSNTQGNVGIESLGKVYLPIPPLDIQNSIIAFLDEKCKKIDSLIAKKQQAIDTMQKYKKSLIYEYVTGKKRIK